MATVSGKTSAWMQAVADASIVSGAVDGSGNLILTTRGGTNINAGNVKGPQGAPGSALGAWPVGSIYKSISPTNPSAALGGGTWVAWGVGRVPVGVDPAQTEFDTVEETGGAKTHTLTSTEMPTHTHAISGDGAHDHYMATSVSTGGSNFYMPKGGGGTLVSGTVDSATQPTGSDHSHSPSNAGGSGAHNNLQPYQTCYMWKRTA